jgi:hypothetical protein
VKRATPATSAGAKIRLCVDPHVCPGRHRFELHVTSERAYLSASDNTGLLYGMYAFIQLLQLHSQVKIYGDGVTAVEIPPLRLSDWPDVPQRAVMWSYRAGAKTGFARLRDNIELFSRLRLNMLMLVVDAIDTEEAAHEEAVVAAKLEAAAAAAAAAADGAAAGAVGAKAAAPADDTADEPPTAITALDEICTNLCVELVPTVVLSTVYDRLPAATLRSFSHPSIVVVFAFDLRSTRLAVADRATAPSSSSSSSSAAARNDAECEAECRRCVDAAMDAALHAGFTSVTCASSEWARYVAAPLAAAAQRGLNAVGRSLDQLCPSSLFLKPVYCAQEYIKALHAAHRRGADDGLALCVFPALMDRDYLFPALLLKYFALLHAGFAWNAGTIVDMLQVRRAHVNMSVLCT